MKILLCYWMTYNEIGGGVPYPPIQLRHRIMVTNTAMATIPRMMACRDGMTTNDMAHKAADTLGRWSRKDRIRLRMIRLWSGVPGSLKISHGKSWDTPALRVIAHAAEIMGNVKSSTEIAGIRTGGITFSSSSVDAVFQIDRSEPTPQ